MLQADQVKDKHNSYLNFRMHMYNAHCPVGTSSSVATYFFESREFAIKALFSDEMDNGVFLNGELVLLLITTYILTLLTYGSGIPAGLFIPNIMTGACFGRLVGQVLQAIINDIDPTIHVNPGVYALIGSTAMLAGFTRMTMSLCVIVLEITTNMFMTLPVMLVIVIAKSVGDLFTPSTYDIVVALKNIPLLEPEIETQGWNKLGEVPIKSVGTPAHALQKVDLEKPFLLHHAADLLVSSRHNAWPVVESAENMRLVGLLTRRRLLDCLEDNKLLPSAHTELHIDEHADAEKELIIDDYVARDPFILLHRTSVLAAHRTFRMLGLRHLCIVNERHSIVSLVTRNDLCGVVEEFVSDYKIALKDFAEDLSDVQHELDATRASRADSGDSGFIEEGVRGYTLDREGLPKVPVSGMTRRHLRALRRERVESQEDESDTERTFSRQMS